MKVLFSHSSIFSIHPDFIGNYLPIVASHLKGNIQMNSEPLSEEAQPFSVSVISEENVKQIRVITLTGAVTKYDKPCEDSMGTLSVARAFDRAYADDSIAGIIFKIDSPGGEARACNHVYQAIERRNKPVIAYVEDMACSAAYYMASAADLIIANYKLARIGCIGTMTTIYDQREYLKKLGVVEDEIYSSLSTDKNSEYRAYLDGNKEPLIAMLDVLSEDFISQVEKGRGDKLNKDRSEWGTGKTYFADEALNIGLIDAIDQFENVVNYFSSNF